MKQTFSIVLLGLFFTISAQASRNHSSNRPGVSGAPPPTGSSSSAPSSTPITTGSGVGQACGYLQNLFIRNDVSGYQQSIAVQQEYLNRLIAQTAPANDFYIQVRTMASIDMNLFIIQEIQSGTLVYNSSQGGVTGLAEIEYPGGAFALDTDIYDSLSTAPGSLTPEMPVRGMENFNGLITYIDDIKNPAKAAYKYEAFRAALDFANRLDRAVAAQNSYVATGHVNFNQIPKAKRFLCAGAYPTEIVKPTVAEWLSKSVYERAVYRAALSEADSLAIWNQLTPAQQSEMIAENQAVGL